MTDDVRPHAMKTLDEVHLRPVAETDLRHLEQLDVNPAMSAPFEWRGFAEPRRRRVRWERDGYLGHDDSMLVVALGDRTYAGIVTWRIATPGRPGCLAIGIVLHPDHRGRGVGMTAHRLLVEHLFATTTVHRIEATTETGNVAEQRCLEHAGFTREGVLRERGFVRGAWQDGVMYSRLRTDAPTVG